MYVNYNYIKYKIMLQIFPEIENLISIPPIFNFLVLFIDTLMYFVCKISACLLISYLFKKQKHLILQYIRSQNMFQ